MRAPWLIVLFVSCSGDGNPEGFCDAACECGSCDGGARQSCLTQAGDNVELAKSRGCDDEMSSFLACIADEGACVDQELQVGEGCGTEVEALNNAGCGCYALAGRPSKLAQCAQ